MTDEPEQSEGLLAPDGAGGFELYLPLSPALKEQLVQRACRDGSSLAVVTRKALVMYLKGGSRRPRPRDPS